MIFQVAQILFGIVLLWKVSDYASRRVGVWLGYSFAVACIGLGIYAWTGPSSGISSLFFLIFIFGGLASLVAAERVDKQGMSGALKRSPQRERASPPPPEPPSPPTYVTNHFTTDNRVFVDARSYTQITINHIEDARQVLQLPLGFSPRQLNKAYDGRRKALEKQASRLPRGDAENRRLLAAEQNRVEEAFLLLTDNRAK